MTFETGLYIALACGVGLLVLGIYVIATSRESEPAPDLAEEIVNAGAERRTTHKHFLRMLLGLNSLEERYIRFTSRALMGFAAIGATTIIGLGASAYLLHRLSDVANQNRTGIIEACHDIESLKTDVRDTLANFIPDGPKRTEAQSKFAAQHCPHIDRPPK